MAYTSYLQDIPLEKALKWAAIGLGAVVLANKVYKELTKYKVAGKVVLITGGSRGLGLELARQLARKGARLAICARTPSQIEVARQQLEQEGAEVMASTADVRDPDQVNALIREVINRFGRLDVLVNNAGIVQVGPQEAMGIAEYEEAMKTNFWASLYTMQAVLPHFMERREGRIVNITSIGGKIAVPHLLPYTASKFALVGLSEGMHAELKKYNILVTTVVPNLMRTGSPRNIIVKGNHEAEYAWFKLSDSSPLLSQKVTTAARGIIQALEYGEAETILSVTAKIATMLQGFAPGWMNLLLSLANKFLPNNVAGGEQSKRGYESESSLSSGPIAALTDHAARVNNQF